MTSSHQIARVQVLTKAEARSWANAVTVALKDQEDTYRAQLTQEKTAMLSKSAKAKGGAS